MGSIVAGVLILGTIADPSQVRQTYVYAALFGVGHGVYSPLGSSTSADLFQGKRFGAVYDVLCVGGGLGSSIGPWASGLLFDLTGGYEPSLIMTIVAAFASVAGLWLSAPRKVRQVPGVAARLMSTARAAAPSGD